MFLPAVSGSQHNTLHTERAAAATDMPHLPPLPVPCLHFKCCAAAVTTDTQTVQLGCAEWHKKIPA